MRSKRTKRCGVKSAMNLMYKVQQVVISVRWALLQVVWNRISRPGKKWQVWKHQAWPLVQHQQEQYRHPVLENPERYK
jgi:hypothetical protein